MPMEVILANNVLCGTALTLLPAIHSYGSASSPHSIATIGRDSRLHNSRRSGIMTHRISRGIFYHVKDTDHVARYGFKGPRKRTIAGTIDHEEMRNC